MKRILPVILALCLLLAGCGCQPTETQPPETTAAPTTEPTTEPTTQPATEPTTAPTTEPETEPVTEPVTIYRNPLNGEVLEEAYVGRVFAVTINNVKAALPHHGLTQADVFFEMFVNDYCTRGLALFSNVEEVESIGSIRSTRYNFTDLALAYDLILVHAGASDAVIKDLKASGVDNMNADGSIGYRDKNRYNNQGYAWEHTLFAVGQDLIEAAIDKGFIPDPEDAENPDQDMEAVETEARDYGMLFTEDATPVDGETAAEIEIVFTLKGRTKSTTMKYDEETGKYVFWQYNKEMVDQNNDEPVAFENVIVILTEVKNDGQYHVAELIGKGDGYFACNGQIVPVTWIHENEEDPILFFLSDGTPLYQGVGSTYIAIAPTDSPVNYQ